MKIPKIAVVLLLSILVVSGLACGGGQPQGVTINKAASGGGARVTVLQKIDPYPQTPSYTGYRYVAMEITIENIGQYSKNVSPFDVKLFDDTGERCPQVIPCEQYPVLGAVELMPGDHITGWEMFGVHTQRHAVNLTFETFWEAEQEDVTLEIPLQ